MPNSKQWERAKRALERIAATDANGNSDPDKMAQALDDVVGIAARALDAIAREERYEISRAKIRARLASRAL